MAFCPLNKMSDCLENPSDVAGFYKTDKSDETNGAKTGFFCL